MKKKASVKKSVKVKKKSKYVPVPPKEHQFKKGQSGNPHGVPKEKRLVNAFTSEQLVKAINLAMGLSVEEAEEVVKDKTLTLPQKVVLRAIVDSAEHGNYSKFYEIAEFILGKIPNKIEVITSLKDQIKDRQLLKQTMKEIEEEI